MSNYFVYILANKRNGTLYIGFTSDLLSRVQAHKDDIVKGFTKKYGVHKFISSNMTIMMQYFKEKNRLNSGKESGK